MILFPAIDLYEKKAVRLYKGDYDRMTVYSDEPVDVAAGFVEKGASHIHIVDLEGAKNGRTPNLETVIRIKGKSGAFCEIGGGIRSMDVIDEYLSCGIDRVILGTSAVEDRTLLQEAVSPSNAGSRISRFSRIPFGVIMETVSGARRDGSV